MRYDFLGLVMQQKPLAVYAFNELLSTIKPRRIIELGTGIGGLTVLLGMYGYFNDCRIVTYDNESKDHDYVEVLQFLGVERVADDIFRIETAISQMIGESGSTLLLCDNGNKAREVNTFSAALKPGDVIMAHDYHPFMTQDPKEIGEDTVCEISYDMIECVCRKYNILGFMESAFAPVMWYCGKRQ